jgi:adenosylcobinamide kinase/adenosylcobinamide-phosphate guanylyltransferase
MNRTVLITGGSRSGKSRHALELAAPYADKAFIGTAEIVDEEMRARIERHRRERGPDFHTVEEPLDLSAALRTLPQITEVTVIDCLTVWLGNLYHRGRINNGTSPEIQAFLLSLEAPPCHLIIVTNELGMGIVPGDPGTRRFRDLAGSINQEIAHRAQEVILTVCGIPLRVK